MTRGSELAQGPSAPDLPSLTSVGRQPVQFALPAPMQARNLKRPDEHRQTCHKTWTGPHPEAKTVTGASDTVEQSANGRRCARAQQERGGER